MSDLLSKLGQAPRFEWTGYGIKVRCVICGRRGYPGGSWQDSCRRGHPWMCGIGDCTKPFSTHQGVANHRRLAHREQDTGAQPKAGS